MKRLFIFFLFTIITGIAVSQTTTAVQDTAKNQTDARGQKQGIWKETLDGGSFAKGLYKNDKKDGIWLSYHPAGFIKSIESYKNGIREGVFISIDDRGALAGEEYYVQDKIDGLSRHFTYGGRPSSEINYKMGMKHGSYKVYYDMTGKLQEESNYVMNKKDGVAKWYDTEGKMVAEYNYRNGELDGPQATYYSNQNKQTEELYKNG
ncbi:MAG: hypothetical protein NTU44_04010, partial [Bacteroidetes bacterium]|nr:hypothetical protein [Bacteroidota bacterium]